MWTHPVAGALLDSPRISLRKQEVRIRPRKTNRGDAAIMEEFQRAMELAGLKVSAEDIEQAGIETGDRDLG
jgi:hypothetical protein